MIKSETWTFLGGCWTLKIQVSRACVRLLLLACLWLASACRCPAEAPRTPLRQAFPVEPLTRYRLAFEAETPREGARWELRIYTAEGLLPFEGLFRHDWQTLSPGKQAYRHEFRTPRDGAELVFSMHHDDAPTTLHKVRLDPVTDANLVINGDFAAGPDNYSGWNTRFLAERVEIGNGRWRLQCEPDGYALTDPIPVHPGAPYRITADSTGGGRILCYDRDLLRVDWRFPSGFPGGRETRFEAPPDTAFIRVEYCDGRAWSGRVPAIERLRIEPVDAMPPPPPEPDLPPYPGEIVLPPDATSAEERAARELQHWVRRIAGRNLRVLAEPSDRDRPRFRIGRAQAEALFPEDLRALEGSDGFAIRRRGADIHVFGTRPAGALFGVIRLLEMNSDLVFARPRQPSGTIYSTNPNLRFDHADLRLRAPFAYRMSHFGSARDADVCIWQGRMGLNTAPSLYNGFRRREMGGVPAFEHNYMGVIEQHPDRDFETLAEQRPDFFAKVDGIRRIERRGYICYTAPGIAEAIADGLRAVVDRHARQGETIEFLDIRTRDGWRVCACDRCLEPIPLPDGTRLEPRALTSERDPRFFSTRMTLMLNQVAESFGRTHPGHTISVPGYIYASEPPAIAHAPSLAPVFAPYPTHSIRFPVLDGQHNHFANGREWEKKFRAFLTRAERGDHRLGMFAYYYPAGFSAVADTAAADWRAIAATGQGVKIHLDGWAGYADQGEAMTPWDYAGMEIWVLSRLMWEPERDPQTLREHYVARAFPHAAPVIQRFYDTIRQTWSDPGIRAGVNVHTPAATLFDTFIVKPGHESTLRDLLSEAADRERHPHADRLIQRTQAAFEHLAESLDRQDIPFVAESTREWRLADSPFWYQALTFDGFKQVSTWDHFGRPPAAQPTHVGLMRDADHLHVRVEASRASPETDLVELHLEAERHTVRYYLALDRNGNAFGMRNAVPVEPTGWEGQVVPGEDRYVALFRIPFALMENLDADADRFTFQAKFGRLVATDRGVEESSLTGFSITKTHYPNYWTPLSVTKEP